MQTGDRAFDAAVNLTGPAAWILAALSRRAREEIREVLDGGGRVEGGRLYATIRVHRPFQLIAHLKRLLLLAQRLSIPDSEVTRLLARRARDVKRADARAALARQLIDHAPLIDRFDQLAAVHRALLQNQQDDLARRLWLAWVGGDPRRVGRLDEAKVLDLMDAAVPLRLAAIERLGAIGGQKAIAPLTAASRGFFTSSSVKRAAKAALGQVIARVGQVEAGGLALAAQDGRLSLDD